MAHFAELSEDNGVTQVVVINDSELLDANGVESEARGIAFLAGLFGHARWKQTSYNAAIRKHYAGVGFTYDVMRDAFISPQPYASWTLDEVTCRWLPPVPRPPDDNLYLWDENLQTWAAQPSAAALAEST